MLFGGGAYAVWPPEFFSIPFSEMAAGTLIRAATSLTLGIISLEFLGACVIAMQADG